MNVQSLYPTGATRPVTERKRSVPVRFDAEGATGRAITKG
jgi:hypothetical protein